MGFTLLLVMAGTLVVLAISHRRNNGFVQLTCVFDIQKQDDPNGDPTFIKAKMLNMPDLIGYAATEALAIEACRIRFLSVLAEHKSKGTRAPFCSVQPAKNQKTVVLQIN